MNFLKSLFNNSKKEAICFPDIDSVFHDKTKSLELVFFPLLTINLGEVIKGYSGAIHFVDFWNNGDINDDHFHEYRTRDIIKFKLKDSKYIYKGNHTLFPSFENLMDWKNEAVNEFENNKEEYIKIKDTKDYFSDLKNKRYKERIAKDYDYGLYIDELLSYYVIKERYKRKKKLIKTLYLAKGVKPKVYLPVQKLGGKPDWIQQDQTPRDDKGKPLDFIGQVVGWHYKKNGCDNIYLFLNQHTNEVIQVFQYG